MKISILFFFILSTLSSMAQNTLADPALEFAFEVTCTLDPPQELGITTYGKRRIIPITGGTFTGPNIKGIILPGGADWQTVRTDGTADLEARYTLKTDDGALIYINNKGIRTGKPEVLARLGKGEKVDPAEYYMRTAATFEVSGEKYSWLNKAVFVGTGMRNANSVIIRFYKVN
ncbi:DUF3237 domain-containing protein [Haliscomenobacter hydrossis]|uniref:UPF0311 protein Halhy_0468 n=1 Tax=Haliscomenobacter hydrossis (strain ATCC 27775 / DSM 1100 / LMG 10767 / O) TaxID=760192 RepID=F4KYB5_HALH1|nr:DUF3237 domain-containing protein [Haliscomenobacter hydrossis]AEE48378.1 hypothetical protein Halhy_0468 [Haliscomenobacter hydrossis DSM 1100]